MGRWDVDAWLDLFLGGGIIHGEVRWACGWEKWIDFTVTVGFIMNHKGVWDMIELLKDLMKYVITGAVGIWAEGNIDQGIREFFSGKDEQHAGKTKRKFQVLCVCVAVIVLLALLNFGIYAFVCKDFMGGTVALLLAGGGILYLVALKINRNN